MQALERKTALLANLTHHRVQRRGLPLKVKASLQWRTLSWVCLSIQCSLLIHHYCCFLALENILFGLQSLSLTHELGNPQGPVDLLQACGVRVAQERVQLVQQSSLVTLAFWVRRRPEQLIQGISKKRPRETPESAPILLGWS